MKTARRLITLAAAMAIAGASPAAAQTAPDATDGPTGGLQATIDQPGLVLAPGGLLQRTIALRGRVTPEDAGRTVRVERQLADASWQTIATVVAGPDATFTGAWKADQVGRVQLRAVVERGGEAVASATAFTAQLTIFKASVASWYGPGFFGKRTACGVRLRRATVGDAHKTLPCGTEVPVYSRGRTLTGPVIDRGPFVAGRSWALTQAAARKLGMTTTSRIGVLPPVDVPLRARR